MTPQLIRKIDRWVGVAVCVALTGIRRVMDRIAGARGAESPIRKIVLLKWIEQGATVLAHDAISEAVERVGRENVFFCVFRENEEIIRILDLIPAGNIITIRHDGILVFLRQSLAAIARIRGIGIDASVDMEFFARGTAIFAYLCGASRRVGLHRFTSDGPYRGDLLTHRLQWNPYLHITQAYRNLVEALFEPVSSEPLAKRAGPSEKRPLRQHVPSPEELERVRKLMMSQGAREPLGRVAILNPNASDKLPLRKWESARFAELGRRLLERHPDLTIVLTGAPGEEASAERIRGEIGREVDGARVISLAGLTTLREVLALYSLAEVMVTNDSGPGHFASLTAVDSIVLFGPETPRLFGSLAKNSHPMWAGLACSPCVNALNHRQSSCGDNVCMQSITVDAVYAQASKLLEVRRLAREQKPARPKQAA